MGNLPWYVTDGVGGFEVYQDYDAVTGQAVDRNNDGMADWIRPDNDLTVNGSISTTWFVEDQYLGASLQLTATGQTSGAVATTEFTDSPRVGSVIVGAQAQQVTTGVGGTTQYTFNVFRGSNNNNTAGATVAITGLPSGVTVSGLTTSITLAATNESTSAYTGTFSLNVPTGLSATSYNFNVVVTATQGGGGDNATGVGTLIVGQPASTTTTVSSSSSTSTYGNAVSFTANVSGNPSVGTVQFYIDGNAFGSALVVSGGVATSASISTINAGSHNVTAVYSGGPGYQGSTSSTITQTVNKANAIISVTPYALTYDGNSHTATGTATGAIGENLSALLDLSGTTHTNAGAYSDSWSFAGNSNYNVSSNTVSNIITKADAVVTVNGYSGTYDAAAHNLSGSVTGVAGDVAAVGSSLTFGASFTDAGNHTGSWSFLGGTNYNNQSGTAAIVIAKADASVVITPYSGT
jgi:hypothetical protein